MHRNHLYMNLRRLFQSIFILTVLVCTGIFFAHPILAASPVDQNAFASFASNAGFSTGPSITIIIARLIRTVISLLGIIAVVIVLYGGFMYMTAGGNEERVKKAKNAIKNGLIGLVIVLMSFTIAQFIVSRLVDATSNADIIAFCEENPSDPSCSKTPPFPPPTPLFSLNPPASIIQCAAGIRNLKLALVFTKSVKDEKGISITRDGAPVSGTFTFSGQKVMFTPEEKCPAPNGSLSCFAPNATFHVEVDPTQVKSASGATLICKTEGGVNPCSFDFTTGSVVDTKPPQEVSMTEPQVGAKAILGLSKTLQVKTVDDTGVASVEFFAADGETPVDVSSVAVTPTTLNGLTSAFFNGAWTPVGFVTNKSYSVWATATDCAGQTKTSSKVSLMLRTPNCDNGTQDASAPYGETGTCAVGASCDCGGNASSEYYCGLCKPSACTSNAQCSSGFCVAGKCQDVPVIQSVSPDNGAVENLITITGSGFGTSPGTVEFLGTESGGTTKIANAFQCGGTSSWKEKEIVVKVPVGAIDGPLKINIPAAGEVAAQSERSDDAVGPIMSKFDVNAIKRPGLCAITPAAEVNASITLTGLSFGAGQGTSSIYLSNFQMTPSAWGATELKGNVPVVPSGTYDAQVFTGDYFCLNASGAKVSPAVSCFSNADCAKVDATYKCGMSWCSETLQFCQDNTACGATGGTCEDIRVGSNIKKFVATNTPSAEKATIATIDTGWKACDSGANAGKHCAKDAECGGTAGSCKSQPTWGPSGQYVTVYGSGFGTATGYVKFKNLTSGEVKNGNIEFPKACGDLFWHNDSVTVKVPFNSDKSAVESGNYEVSVVPQAGAASDAKSFTVVDGKPTPGICLLSKNAGPVGSSIDIFGENLGDQKGTVMFTSNLSEDPGSWTGTEIGSASVPVGTKSGPVYVVDAASNQSNSVNFAVGNCQQTPGLCTGGQTCCGDGSCSLAGQACPSEGPKVAQFVYKVSTSPIPVAPTVVVNCTDPTLPKPSPSPSPLWSAQNDICVSAAVTASFAVPMDPTTIGIGNTNILIEKCPTAKEANGTCAPADWQAVAGSFQAPGEYTFQWSPSTNFDTNTLHRVTIKGASAPGGGVKSKVNGLIPSASMAQDYSWEFRTSTSNAPCGVGGVSVSPDVFTAKNAGDSVGYLAQLLSNKDKCVVLACTGHSVSWSSSQWAAPFLPGNTITVSPPAGVCTASVNPAYNTPIGVPAQISATVTDVGNKPTNKGLLTISLTNPKVSDYFPNCSSACTNVKPWVSFNVPMNPAFFAMSGAIRVFQCQNSLCEKNALSSWNHVTSVVYDPATYRATIVTDGTAFIPNTWYRVVVADWIKSSMFALLSESGSNYGTLENKFYPGAFSWRFKSKDSLTSCAVDRVGLSPKSATLQYVGQRQEYNAIAYGAPDECSVTGQALQSTGWSGWSATDTPNKVGAASYVTGADHKYNEITAFLLNNGSLALANTLPKICGGNCLYTGNPIKVGQAVCGNSVVNYGESCDDGNTNDKDGCSSSCLKEGTAAPTCGNGTVAAGEQCDDGNLVGNDGCSEKCLYEGSSSIKAICGDGVIDKSNTNGGEACDDGNTKEGDGCSSNCLFEGGVVAYSSARCGDGAVGAGETCDPGAHCANGAVCTIGGAACQDGSKCSVLETEACSELCLNRGTNPGSDPTKSLCGNGVSNSGEDAGCDLGVGLIADGCSKKCLKMGSNPNYPTPSICGNGGALEVGEQCEAAASATYAVGAYGVAEISSGASLEVEKDNTKATYGYAISNVEVSVGGKKGTSEVKLLCSCAADNQCGIKAGTSESLGCGVEKCCFERPKITTMVPGNDALNVCRNTAISVTFNQEMDANTFGSADTNGDGKISAEETDSNLQLELIQINGNAVTFATDKDNNGKVSKDEYGPTDCPYYPKQTDPKNFFVGIWQWIKGLFGRAALADATTQCFVPLSYEQDLGTHQVYLRYKESLLPNAKYKLTVKTKNGETSKGVLSKNKVSICLGDNGTTCQTVSQTNTFTTGVDVCLLDVVQTIDSGIAPTPPTYLSKSPGYYSKTNEVHDFATKPFSYRKNTGLLEEISPIAGLYAWTWSWAAIVKDTATSTDILGVVAPSVTQAAQYKALGKNGSGNVIATATISADTISKTSTVGSAVSGHVSEIAFLCENPWPDLTHGVPFVENGANTNFSLFYCRDIGKPEEGKTLPALELPPTDATPDVNQLITTDVLKELVFRVSGTKDSIGVRVLSNPKYLSPMAWFKSQGFTGTPKAAKLDGYEAVQTGTTIYAAAANRNGSNLYSNIYVISFNSDAGKDAQQIFNLVLQNFRLNANDTGITGVSHVGLCKSGGAYIPSGGPFIACSWDGDCLNQCKPDGKCSITNTVCDPKLGNAECVADPNAFCDADKQKLIRDTKRLADITEMVTTFEKYGNTNGRCAVTKSQKCVVSQNSKVGAPQNPACPGTETCIPSYPTIQAGTFVPSMSNSIWPSWNSTLGNAVGGALPTDPLNQFWGQCKSSAGNPLMEVGYDSATCWNGKQGKFLCPDGSHVYGYQNLGGESYTLSTQLEYSAVAWNNKIDDASDKATIQASYPKGTSFVLPSGFTVGSSYCNATVFGSTASCGDGVKSAGEDCEIGEVSTVACAAGGFINVTCKNDCKKYLDNATAEKAAKDAGGTCTPFKCGNGVIDKGANPPEVCDDGALNGTYGHCGKNCTIASDFACGDGYLAGNEQCDCGTPTNFLTVKADVNSWANKNCTVENGKYLANGLNCTADCKAPGPKCGDNLINDSSEKCDGNTETYAGALCSDGTKCTKNSDCSSGTCGGTTATIACTKSKICIKGDVGKIGSICTEATKVADCGATGVCSTEQYDLTRTRTCQNYNNPSSNSCQWITNAAGGGWGACAGGPQQCGNGKKEGTEECDDGNSSSNDSCTNACKANVCGDNFVNVGIESCDSGIANGTACNAAYGSSCNFCNQFCQYKTQSGPYCGDGTLNGNEYCDGSQMPYQCFKANQDKSEVQGTCSKADEGKQGTCPSGYTCRLVGVCNGGSLFGENAKLCTPYPLTGSQNINNCDGYCSGDPTITCNHDLPECAGKGVCIGYGSCVPPVCADNCGSSCPTAFQKVALQVQGNVAESQPSSSITLFKLNNAGGKTPDRASLLLPACRVGVGLTANVSTASSLLNSGNTVSIIAATFKNASGKYVELTTETTALDIGNGLKLPFSNKFICHDVPFSLPLNVTLNPSDASVTFSNIEFTYCPIK